MFLNNAVSDILFILLMILLFYKARLVKPLCSLNQGEYLSVETGNYYRGFFAVVIVFHHLALNTDTGFVFQYFSIIGYLAVSVFFFQSGYGLQKSYITKSDNYRKRFLLKRIPTVLIPYIIITAIYWIMYYADGKIYSVKDIFISIIDGKPIALYSWYIICILIFYVVYWLLMTVCGKHYFSMIVCGTVWYLLYTVFCIKMGYGGYWCNASQLLIVGMIWATYERKILELLKKAYFVIAPVIGVLFLVLFIILRKKYTQTSIADASVILTFATAVLFVLSVLMFSLKVKIGNKALGFLGDISLEIYISQGIFLKVLRSDIIYIENEFLWCIAVLTGTVVFSYFLHMVFQFILRKYRKLLNIS